MPKIPTHALIWSDEQGVYELHPTDPLLPYVVPGEEEPWLAWLATHTSFSFQGQAGRLNVLKESWPRGEGYWYAYRTKKGRTRKRYLGRTEHLSLTHLEETARALLPWQPPTQAREQGMLLLSSRLTPPRLPNSLVQRERLLAALDEALATRLSLLCAPAGFGKTTLLSAWASRHQAQVAWFSLDELDNSPTRFWVSLIAALRRCGGYAPNLGETTVALLSSPQPPPLPTILMALLQELESLEAHPVPVVLMVDDYQVLDDPAIHESMSFFLEHLPAHVHVILSSRVDPDLKLSRWRVRGQLTEIRAADLRFREGEASQFLGQVLSPPLPRAEVRKLLSRTEGWIAGLQLAALALRKREDRTAFLEALTGSQRYLLDYVQEEVLARLPEKVRDFLLHTAILSRLDASVCQAVSAEPQRAASQQMLVFLERANLFLVPLDEERRSYRLHELFREALLSILHATQPDLLLLLHRRAVAFYETQQQWHEAIAHALEAADFSNAACLMERAAPRCWLNGEAQTVQTWLVSLPDAVLWQHARLVLQATLRLLDSLFAATETAYARAQTLVEPMLARLAALLHQHIADADQLGEVRVIERRLRLLRALLETRAILQRGESARLVQLAREVEGLPQEDLSWQVATLIIDCYLIEGFQHAGALLIPRLLEAKQQAEWAGEFLASLRVRSWLAQTYERAAQWPQVERECLAGLALLEQGRVHTIWAGYLQVCLAEAYYAWNRLDEATDTLQEALRIGQDWQQLELLIEGQLDVAQIALARGALPAADQALSQAEALSQCNPWAYLPSPVAACRVRYWLATGELKAAQHWAEQATFFPGTLDPNDQWVVLMQIRVHLALGQYLQALELLERFRGPLNRPDDTLTATEWLALHSVALHQAGQQQEAQVATARLLALTETSGAIRVYLDEGEPMRETLLALLPPHSKQHELAPSTTTYVSKLLAAFEQEAAAASTSLQGITTPEPALPASRKASGTSPGLTAREVEVLRQLSAGLTDAQIAEQLVISPRTVNAHLTSIYRKIAVSSRAAATRYALEHHLA